MLKLFNSKIFIKQFLSYFFVMCITFLTISFVVLKTSAKSMEEYQLYMTETYRKQASDSMEKWLNGEVNDLKNQALYISQLEEYKIRSKELLKIFKSQTNRDNSLVDILVVDEEGNIINSAEDDAKLDLSLRNFYLSGIGGESIVTGFYTGAKLQMPVMAISNPIYIKEKPKYVLLGIIELDKVRKFVENLNLGEWGHAYLVDSDGVAITSSNYINEFVQNKGINDKDKYKLVSDAITKVTAKKEGTEVYNNFNGKRVFGSYEWLDPIEVGLIIEFNYKDTMMPITHLMNGIELLVLMVLVIGSVLAFFISKKIIDPVNKLIGVSQNIIGKNYKESIFIKTDSELDVLGKTFNKMEKILLDREAQLEKKNKALREQTQRAIEASKLKSEFLANMSHELRTPLNSIIGFTTRVIKKTEEFLPVVQLENLKIVREQAWHLLDLINGVLDYSKIEAGKMIVYNESFALIEVINEVEAMINVLIEGEKLILEKEIDIDNKATIFSDRIKIKQMLINLLSNAVKYSEKGRIVLSISKSEKYYSFAVKDEGIGIDTENLNTIFDEFRQVDGSYTRKVGGTGLGLSITKRFAEMLGGTIGVISESGKGSCFYFNIPVKLPENIEEDKTKTEHRIRKVISIDDDPNAQRLYKEYLSEHGFSVIALNGNEDVIKKISETMPDIVLLDIVLPNKDGWYILNQIKSNNITKKIPVIMISVLNEKKLAFKLHVDEYLVKPITQDELIDSIMQIIKNYEK